MAFPPPALSCCQQIPIMIFAYRETRLIPFITAVTRFSRWSESARAFLEWCDSEAAVSLLRSSGYDVEESSRHAAGGDPPIRPAVPNAVRPPTGDVRGAGGETDGGGPGRDYLWTAGIAVIAGLMGGGSIFWMRRKRRDRAGM